LNGFDNPMRDAKTEEAKRHIGEGAKVRMDEKGNIHIKRVSKSNIYVKNTADENSIGNDILKLPQGALEFGKGFLVSCAVTSIALRSLANECSGAVTDQMLFFIFIDFFPSTTCSCST
jgi:MH2 domain